MSRVRQRSLYSWLGSDLARWRRRNWGLLALTAGLALAALTVTAIWVYQSICLRLAIYNSSIPYFQTVDLTTLSLGCLSLLVGLTILVSLLALGTWNISEEMHGAFKPREVYGAMLGNARRFSYWMLLGYGLIPLSTHQLREDITNVLLPRWVVGMFGYEVSLWTYWFDVVLLQVLLLAFLAEGMTLVALRLANRSLWLRFIATLSIVLMVPVLRDFSFLVINNACPRSLVIAATNLYLLPPLLLLIAYNNIRPVNLTERMLSGQVARA